MAKLKTEIKFDFADQESFPGLNFLLPKINKSNKSNKHIKTVKKKRNKKHGKGSSTNNRRLF